LIVILLVIYWRGVVEAPVIEWCPFVKRLVIHGLVVEGLVIKWSSVVIRLVVVRLIIHWR
jgi:hypothetical protein